MKKGKKVKQAPWMGAADMLEQFPSGTTIKKVELFYVDENTDAIHVEWAISHPRWGNTSVGNRVFRTAVETAYRYFKKLKQLEKKK